MKTEYLFIRDCNDDEDNDDDDDGGGGNGDKGRYRDVFFFEFIEPAESTKSA